MGSIHLIAGVVANRLELNLQHGGLPLEMSPDTMMFADRMSQ